MLEEREVRWTSARRAALAYVREEIHPHTAGEIDRVQKALSDLAPIRRARRTRREAGPRKPRRRRPPRWPR